MRETPSKLQLWKRFQQYYSEYPSLGLALDLSRMNFADSFLSSIEPRMQRAFADMEQLERGAIANPDEKRMVGHYWLRAPQLAPKPDITAEIQKTIADIKKFAADVHSAAIRPPAAPRFTGVLVIGIGGSALGPMFVADALGNPATDRMRV